MPNHTHDAQNVTLGEVYRLVQTVKDDCGEINERLRELNGSVAKHSARLDIHDRSIEDVKRIRGASSVVATGGDAITRRDLQLVIGVIVALWALAQTSPAILKAVEALAR